MRVRLRLEYDGGAFHGWQRQPGLPTVQGALEQALAQICGHAVSVAGAGRTDSGVHALGQAAHFDTRTRREPAIFRRALNALTPRALTILDAWEVDETFHARHSAIQRRYLYRLNDRPVPLALAWGRLWHDARPLDVDAMRVAAEMLLGTHDFTSFRAAACQADHPNRTIDQVAIVRDGHEVRFSIAARSFLHHMVRNIVGSLVPVGRGEWTPERFGQVLAARDRSRAGPTAPPQGLYLTEVVYPDDETDAAVPLVA